LDVVLLNALSQFGPFRKMEIQGGTAMQSQGRQRSAGTPYEHHRPEQTLLFQIIEAHYPALVKQLSQQGKSLPDHVHREFDAYLKCGRLEHGFLLVLCDKRGRPRGCIDTDLSEQPRTGSLVAPGGHLFS
jgi:hypothetical protein